MRRLSKPVAAIAFVAATATALLFGAPAAYAQSDYAGCPTGYVCIYSGANWDTIVYKESRAGAWNLSNMYGVHRVFNNQTNNWIVRLCTGWNGANCGFQINSWVYSDYNLTPINSIRISP